MNISKAERLTFGGTKAHSLIITSDQGEEYELTGDELRELEKKAEEILVRIGLMCGTCGDERKVWDGEGPDGREVPCPDCRT